MSKSNSLFKIFATSFAVLGGINFYVDSMSNVKSTRSGNSYKWKYGNIFYTKKGTGEPLLLLHDLSVFSSGQEWKEIINELSEEYTVYVPDLPGCGKSCKLDMVYTNYFYVQFIRDFVKEVIGSKTNVISTGKASSLVLMADANDTELFNKLTFINPETIANSRKIPDDRSKVIDTLFSLPIIGRTAYYIATNKQNTEYYLTEECFYNPFKVEKDVVAAYYRNAHRGEGKGKSLLASLDGNYLNSDISRVLAKTTKDITLILSSENEKKEEIHSTYKKCNSEIKTIQIYDSKHLPQLETPEELLEVLL